MVDRPGLIPGLGQQASILPSSCLKWKEHMKKMQRQKMTSTSR